MDERFVLSNIEYMWTDRDQVCAIEIRTAYNSEKRAGKDHRDALLALRGKIATEDFYASPYRMLIPLFTQAHPEKLWDKLISRKSAIALNRPPRQCVDTRSGRNTRT